MNELDRNGSGYKDPTASTVLNAIQKREQEIDERAARVVKLTKELLNFCGFELIERVQIRHKASGREYK